MREKWLMDDENLLLKGKAMIWYRRSLQLNGAWYRIFVTNKRFYISGRVTGMKAFDIRFSEIKSIEDTGKDYRFEIEQPPKKYTLTINKKYMSESWITTIEQYRREG